jgi:hypothetical protein
MFNKLKAANTASFRKAVSKLKNIREVLFTKTAPGYVKYPIGSIKDEIDILPWELETDFAEGGNSRAWLDFKKEDKALHFFGELANNKETSYEKDLYARMKQGLGHRFKLVNGVEVRVLTDGQPYEIILLFHQFAQHEVLHG